jgi:hypothetical protein
LTEAGLTANAIPATDFFAEFAAAAATACDASGDTVVIDLALGSSLVRLRFAGDAFADPVLRAIGHLSADGDVPDATITIWDSASTGVPAPGFPWTETAARGTPVGFDHPRLRTIVDPGFGGVTMFDTDTRTGVVWAPSAANLPWWERAAPLRAALYWSTVRPGQHFVHAGAVGTRSGGVLFAGRGGSGKSTLALACVEHGLLYAGDDYVLVTDDPAPAAHCVYRSAKVDPASFDLVPGMRGAADGTPAPGDKAVLDVASHRPDSVVSHVPLTAIVHPRITTAREPVLREVSAREGLLALAPSTVYQLPGDGSSALATLGAIARQVPSYVLEAGPDAAANAACIARLVEETS